MIHAVTGLHPLGGFGEQLVARSERVEDHVAVEQQVLAPVGLEADRVRKHLQRIGLREIVDAIDWPRPPSPCSRSSSASASAVNVARICITVFGDRIRDSTARVLRVVRRIGLEDQAPRPERRLLVEVRQPDAGATR